MEVGPAVVSDFLVWDFGISLLRSIHNCTTVHDGIHVSKMYCSSSRSPNVCGVEKSCGLCSSAGEHSLEVGDVFSWGFIS